MPNITIKFKDGTIKRFLHTGRSGGSYTKTIRYEGSFVIVTDEWSSETAFPASDISEIKSEPERQAY
jgi:hypothetical protein